MNLLEQFLSESTRPVAFLSIRKCKQLLLPPLLSGCLKAQERFAGSEWDVVPEHQAQLPTQLPCCEPPVQ